MTIPQPLRPGDRIAILSPATEIKSGYIDGAVAELRSRGYEPVEMPYTRGHEHGTFAATDAQRLADLTAALSDSSIKAILCGRGGYGCIHLLSYELQRLVSDNPKWIIGFSDISALHAVWLKAGVRSIHASMAKQLTLYGARTCDGAAAALMREEALSPVDQQNLDFCTDMMWRLLEHPEEETQYSWPDPEGNTPGEETQYSRPTPEGNTPGAAEGLIVGGNLAVLNGLAATPWDILTPERLEGKILFLEDVGEKIYQVERMLTRLHLSGALHAVAGLIFGDFTDYRPDCNFDSMQQMIRTRLDEWRVSSPTALYAPIGHTHFNLPVPEGATARLAVTDCNVTLTFPGS